MLSIIKRSEIVTIGKIFFGVLLIAAAAQIRIPIKPVPATLQTLAAVLIGLLYAPRDALKTWSLYLICGALGMPIFNNFSSGIEKFIGPTAGYLFGMTLASYSMAYLRINYIDTKKITHIIGLVILGQMIIYVPGVLWLSTLIGLDKAIISGFIVFIPSGIVKSLIISLIFRYLYNAEA